MKYDTIQYYPIRPNWERVLLGLVEWLAFKVGKIEFWLRKRHSRRETGSVLYDHYPDYKPKWGLDKTVFKGTKTVYTGADK